MAFRLLLRAACFVAVVLLLAGFTWATFQPKARYHVPSDEFGKRMNCLYRLIYEDERDAQILVFGSSRTAAAINAPILAWRASEESGDPVTVAKLSMAGANPGLSYQVFQEYLARHKAPKLIVFEAEQVRNSPSVVPYVNRFFTITALPQLYLDVVTAGTTEPLLQRMADALRLLVDHYDKSLSKALSPQFTLELQGTVCTDGTQSNVPDATDLAADAEDLQAKKTAKKQKRKAMAALKRNGKAAENEARIAARQGIERSKTDLRRVHRAIKERGETWETMPFWDWGYTTPEAQRYLYYYRKFVDWAAENDAHVVFIRFPNYLEPPSTEQQGRAFEDLVGAPVLVPDLELLRQLYPLYKDDHHVSKAAWTAIADWIMGGLRDHSAVPGAPQ